MFAQESVMEIQKEQEAFERFKAKQTGMDYETLKKDLDDCEKRFPNNRYAGWNFKSDWELWQAATAQAVPEGFVLVKKELPEQIAEKMAIDRIDKPTHENDPVWSEIAEESYKNQVKLKKWEFWRDYKAMIEAQEPAND